MYIVASFIVILHFVTVLSMHGVLPWNYSCLADLVVIQKFAILEFKLGEPERAITMFESLLSTYPRRIDIWSTYIDQMIKLRNAEPVR